VLTPELRERMGNAAREAARAAQYTNAGTVEFLLDEKLNFYFMEMNTRLQVEHPVTEFVTGTDLVFWQVAIAGGEEIPERFKSLKPRGWAMECRISSEDPFNDFLPSAGKITAYEVPGGPWVRVDSGVTVGSEVTLFYDPLMAKLIVWAQTRQEVLRRMRRALSEFRIAGVKTTVPFHLLVLGDRDFQKGVYDTSFLSKKTDLMHLPGDSARELAAMLGALVTKAMEPAAGPKAAGREPASTAHISPWKRASFADGVSRNNIRQSRMRDARRSGT
jgi:acetyl-CoA carboxylase biotin carboxylase subunit